MTQTVLVKATYDDGTAQVLHIRQSACSGDCHKCSGCGAAQEALMLRVENPIGAKPGDMVIITSQTGPVLTGAAILYLLPLLLFFLGYLLGSVLWSAGAVAGCVAFLLGIVVTVVYDRKVAGKQNNTYIITGLAQSEPGGF